MISEKKLFEIRGKALVEAATTAEILSVFEYIDILEYLLDEADCDDTWGTEGWRKAIGQPR